MQASGSRSYDIHEKAFKQELGLDETSYISKDPMALALFFKDEGIKFYKKREYDIAMIYFSKAIECDPLNKVYYSNRAASHFSRGNYKLALRDSLKSIELDPTYMTGYYRGAISYLEMNKVDSALELISLFRERSPEKQEKEENQENSQDENKNPEGEKRKNALSGLNASSLPSCYNNQNIEILYQNIVKKKIENEAMIQKFPSFKKFLTFNNWLYNGECHFPKLELKFYSDSHRGIVAKSDIEKDEIILKVPKEMLISIELAKSTSIGEKIASFMYIELNSPKHCLLTSYLLAEFAKGEDSVWKDYLEILPKNYTSFPIFFTEQELSFLDGSPFKQQVIEKKQDILKDYEKICYFIPEFAQYDYKLFCETRMAVSSRIFGVKIDFKKTDVLAPFADLLNHKRPRSTHWYYDEKYKSFIIQALEDIPKFSEVYDSYGKKCNSRFLLNYGFVIEENDANEYPVSLSLDKTCPLYDQKKAFFHKDFEMNKKFRISENIVDYAVVDLFSYLRFIYFDGEIDILYKIISENQKIIFEDITPTFYLISPITEDLEIKILTKIKDLMIEYISQYTTSLEEDNAILEKDKKEPFLTNNQRNCIVMRQSEKKILKFYEYFATYCLNLFQLTEKVSL